MSRSFKLPASKCKLLTEQEEKELAERIQKGDVQARNKLACSNLRLIPVIASKYTRCGASHDELTGAGCLGLLLAAEKFNPSRGRFSQCAAAWIRKEILDLLSSLRLVSIPDYRKDQYSAIRKAHSQLLQKKGGVVTVFDVKLKTGFEPELIEDALKPYEPKLSFNEPDQEKEVYFCCRGSASLEPAEKTITRIQLSKGIQTLSKREREIIHSYFVQDKTLDEIGKNYRFTRERVRQIKGVALQKLKAHVVPC